MEREDRRRLESLPWQIQLEEWESNGVPLLVVRRGDSRHPVVFVERQGVRYAIKETTPRMAEREIRNLHEVERRGIPALSPIGTVVVSAPPIALDIPNLRGMTQYISGDRGYTVTRLAPRVVPHVLLYRLPLTRRTKQRLLAAVALLMVELHEHGVYWGDPSLANALIRIDGRQILSIMADAETAELFPGPISEGLREQDLAQFGESLAWQAEDLRQARGLPEEVQVLDDADYEYFRNRYRIVRRQHARVTGTGHFPALDQTQNLVENVNSLGGVILEKTRDALKQITTILPGWYQKRIYDLLHITIPRPYARRFYNLILGHQAILQKNRGHEVSIQDAAQDWYERYHLPTILLLKQRLTSEQDPMQIYFEIMQYKWDMSVRAGYELPLEQVITYYMMQNANTGKIVAIDPAYMATWWHQRKSVASVLEPPLIEGEELDPLLITADRPLVHLQPPELEQKLPEILEHAAEEMDENA